MSWLTITEFPQYEIHEKTGQVRRIAHTKIVEHKVLNKQGELVSGYVVETRVPAKPLTPSKGNYSLWHNGKIHGRAATTLWKKYVLKEEPRQKTKKYRKMRRLLF